MDSMKKVGLLSPCVALVLMWISGCPKPGAEQGPRPEPRARPSDERPAPVVGPHVSKMRIAIIADPKNEKMHVSASVHLQNMKPGSYTAVFAEPRVIHRFVEKSSGETVAHKLTPIPGVPAEINLRNMEFTIVSAEPRVVLLLEYAYDRDSLVGYAPNPTTHDNLHLGQLRKEFIFSSHLYYYPMMFSGPEKAELSITAPQGWKGVSSGRLTSVTQGDDGSTFHYHAGNSSGRLPYPLAIYPYEELAFTYDGRVPVTIYHAKADSAYAKQKADLIREKILPFLENLMGSYPFEHLRVVEVFPWEGNTGLAARGLVMLSEKVWFAADIGEDLSVKPAIVLVDEIAHQWNFYRVQLPNFLAEGVSQYTDALFVEKEQGKEAFEQKLAEYTKGCAGYVKLLTELHKLHVEGLSSEDAAKRLKLTGAQIAPLWPYAKRGNVPITDPQVFPPFYFLRGVMALQALREKLGDAAFFNAFRSLFSAKPMDAAWTLADFREHFEKETGSELKPFFSLWYESAELPK